MYFDHISPSSSTSLNFASPFSLLLSTKTNFCCYTLVHVGHPLEHAWSTHTHTFKENWLSQKSSAVNSSPARDRAYECLPSSCWNADWLDLVRSCTANYSCSEFLSTTVQSCPQDTVQLQSSSTCDSYTLSTLLFLNGPWVPWDGLGYRCPTCHWPLHRHLFSILWPLLEFLH